VCTASLPSRSLWARFPNPKGSDGGHTHTQPRILVLSLPHGKTVDKVAGELLPLLEKGDVIMDGGNEWWEETERQKWAAEMGVEWVGTGVSGGCVAQVGPRPSGSSWSVNLARAWEVVRPWLEKWAPRADGEPCVARIGPGGSGHCKWNFCSSGDLLLTAL
jgi:6-phosphogluconate dehydrogenase